MKKISFLLLFIFLFSFLMGCSSKEEEFKPISVQTQLPPSDPAQNMGAQAPTQK